MSCLLDVVVWDGLQLKQNESLVGLQIFPSVLMQSVAQIDVWLNFLLCDIIYDFRLICSPFVKVKNFGNFFFYFYHLFDCFLS